MFGKKATNSETDANSPEKSRKKPPSFLRLVQRSMTTMGIIVLVGLFCLPWLASSFLKQQTAEKWISESLPGNIKIGDASVGWNSPVMLNDVVFEDEAGKKLAEIKAVTSNQTMLDLLRNQSRPMELEFEGMRATFVVPRLKAAQTSNKPIDIESVVEDLFKQKVPKPARDMTIRIVRSELTLTDAEGKSLARWSPIKATYESSSATPPKQKLKIDAPVASLVSSDIKSEANSGNLGFVADWTGSTSPTTKESLSLTLDCAQQPLAVLQPLVETYFPDMIPGAPVTFQIGGLLERVGQEELLLKLDTQLTDHQPLSTSQSPLNFDVEASYSQKEDRIDVPRLFAQVDETSVDLQAEVTDVSGKQVVDAQGQFRSPAEGLANLLPESMKENVQFKEIEVSDLSIKGPLRPDPSKPFDLKFELSTIVSWKEATAYGITSKDGKVKLTMAGNDLLLTPIEIPVSGGHIRQLPSFDLSTTPLTVKIQEGLTLDKVALTEEICHDWLRYVSPLLSDATRPSGTFSLVASPATFQLEKMNEANLSGKLNIHKAQVRPGPLADEIINMVSAVRAAKGPGQQEEIIFLEMENQTVDYQVVDGRVYHAGFNFKVGDFDFSSNGSVGFDETLDLVISMAFPDELANRGPILQSLQDEALVFKVTGTMDKPVIKGDQLKDVGKRIGIKAAEGLLERILERRGNRGVRPRRGR